MKRKVNAFDYANTICKAMPRGILLTTKAGEQVNTMTIGWGHIGIEWGKPIFVAYVRQSRHTLKMLEANREFTVNVPVDGCDGKILGYCGTKSGRDTDKISDLGLTLEPGETVSVPGIRELPLTLECKVIYTQTQDLPAIPAAVQSRYYPAVNDHENPDIRQDVHTVFYGEILNAYLIEG